MTLHCVCSNANNINEFANSLVCFILISLTGAILFAFYLHKNNKIE
jgi:hypothetical protein